MSALMLDLHGYEIDAEEKEILQHPMVGGLILFSRNFDNVKQLTELTQQIKKLARQPILIAVDQEGGEFRDFVKGLVQFLRCTIYIKQNWALAQRSFVLKWGG